MRQQPVTLTDDHVWIISTLSDALALNEALCLNLLLEADTIFGLQGRTRAERRFRWLFNRFRRERCYYGAMYIVRGTSGFGQHSGATLARKPSHANPRT